MSHRATLLALAGLLACGASAFGAGLTTSFEGADPLNGWATTGAPAINTNPTYVHSGTQSLWLDGGAGAGLLFAPAGELGTLTIWIYDLGHKNAVDGTSANGPRWGGINPSNEIFADAIWDRSYASDQNSYHVTATDTGMFGSQFSGWGGGNRILNGWNQFVFTRLDAASLPTLSVNGSAPILAGEYGPGWVAGNGFAGVLFYGGANAELNGVYIDDVSFVSAAVPEPASLCLLGMGAGTLLLARRRRA